MTASRVVVVGGGIAGLAAAYFARRRGCDVTVVDAALHRASDLPVALVNPVRGREGRVVARGLDGMAATFALVDALVVDGHAIAHGRGLLRPLLGDSRDRATWEARLPAGLRRRWHDRAPASLGLAHDGPALELPDAGWIAPRGLLDALRTHASRVVVDETVTIAPRSVVLAGGERLAADRVAWCGGAWGASRFDRAEDDGHYRPGSLVVAQGSVVGAPLAFGLYAVPRDDGTTVLGPTHEPTRSAFAIDDVDPAALGRLEADLARVLASAPRVAPLWRGVRVSRLSSSARAALHGIETIAALGSRGFLLAPLVAREWAASL